MKIFKFLILFIFLCPSVQSEEFPISPKITYGKLHNGLTYYIRENKNPKDKVYIQLFIKTGSLNEREDQRGLAHMIEHMAFQGSKNFPKNKIEEYFSSIGLSLGADYNAHTGFDETVYKFSIPVSQTGAVETGIYILSEIAGYLELNPKDFEDERKIIEEEYRQDLGVDKRISKKKQNIFYKGSMYQKRDPIGDLEVIRNFKPEVAIEYYQDFYRPDLMAVMVVGDIHSKEIKKWIEKYFNRIPKRKDQAMLADKNIPRYLDTNFSVITDPEELVTSFGIIQRHPRLVVNNVTSYQSYITDRLAQIIFNKRLRSLKDVPFYNSYLGFNTLSPKADLYFISANLRENQMQTAMERLNLEMERVFRYGFELVEIDLAKQEFETNMLQHLQMKSTEESLSYIPELEGHFTEGEMISGIEYEYALVKKLLPQIQTENINDAFRKYRNQENRIILLVTNDKNKNKMITKQQYENMENNLFKQAIPPYVVPYKKEALVSKTLAPKPLVYQKEYKDIATTEIYFENGVKVLLRPSKLEIDQIQLSALSMGGFSRVLDDKKIPAAKFTSTLIAKSGLGNFTRDEIRNVYPSKFVEVYPTFSDYEEGLEGHAFKPYLKQMFEMIYLHFTKVQFDEKAFALAKNSLLDSLKNEDLDPDIVFNRRVREAYFNTHPRAKSLNLESVSSIQMKDSIDFYLDRFGSANDFVFVFTGDFDMKEMIQFCEIYLGNLPTIKRNDSYIDHGIRVRDNYYKEEFRENRENQATGRRYYSSSFSYHIKERLKIYLLTDILNKRLRDIIREKYNYVYSIQAINFRVTKYPREEFSIGIYFNCDPKNIELIYEKINEVIAELKTGKLEDKYFKDEMKRKILFYKNNYERNRFWRRALVNYTVESEDIEKINQLHKIIGEIKKKDLIALANNIFDENYLEFSLLPKN